MMQCLSLLDLQCFNMVLPTLPNSFLTQPPLFSLLSTPAKLSILQTGWKSIVTMLDIWQTMWVSVVLRLSFMVLIIDLGYWLCRKYAKWCQGYCSWGRCQPVWYLSSPSQGWPAKEFCARSLEKVELYIPSKQCLFVISLYIPCLILFPVAWYQYHAPKWTIPPPRYRRCSSWLFFQGFEVSRKVFSRYVYFVFFNWWCEGNTTANTGYRAGWGTY